MINSALIALLALLSGQEAPADTSPHSSARLHSGQAVVVPGKSFEVLVQIKMDPHWHCYWSNPGDSGQATSVQWNLPKGWVAGPLRFATPKAMVADGFTVYGYEDVAWFATTITPPKNAKVGKNFNLAGKVTWLICKETCLPATENIKAMIRVGKTPFESPYASEIAQFKSQEPIQMPNWKITARIVNKEIQLVVDHGGQTDLPLAGGYFFAIDNEVVAHSQPQKITTSPNGFEIALPLSEFASKQPERIRGILVCPKGKTWNGKSRAVRIDVKIS